MDRTRGSLQGLFYDVGMFGQGLGQWFTYNDVVTSESFGEGQGQGHAQLLAQPEPVGARLVSAFLQSFKPAAILSFGQVATGMKGLFYDVGMFGQGLGQSFINADVAVSDESPQQELEEVMTQWKQQRREATEIMNMQRRRDWLEHTWDVNAELDVTCEQETDPTRVEEPIPEVVKQSQDIVGEDQQLPAESLEDGGQADCCEGIRSDGCTCGHDDDDEQAA